MASSVEKVLFLLFVISVRRSLPVTAFVTRSLGLESFVSLSHSQESFTLASSSKKTQSQDDPFGRVRNQKSTYNLGLGKNQPVLNITKVSIKGAKKSQDANQGDGDEDASSGEANGTGTSTTTRKLVATDEGSDKLRAALWDESHYSTKGIADDTYAAVANWGPPSPVLAYPDIDLSIPDSVYKDDGSVDHVWDLLRYEAYQESLREPLLVSFLYSTILNHPSLESSLAFLLGNRLQSPAMMISTQLQSLILEALHQSPDFRRALRADMMAVRDRDPACNALPDVFLYFKVCLFVSFVSSLSWRRHRD